MLRFASSKMDALLMVGLSFLWIWTCGGTSRDLRALGTMSILTLAAVNSFAISKEMSCAKSMPDQLLDDSLHKSSKGVGRSNSNLDVKSRSLAQFSSSGFPGGGPSGFSTFSGPSGFPSFSGPSGFPDFPDSSQFPDFPDSSEFPDFPENSEFPDFPENSEFPDFPEDSGFPDFPEDSGFPDFPENSNFPDPPGDSDFPDFPKDSDFLDFSQEQKDSLKKWSNEVDKNEKRHRSATITKICLSVGIPVVLVGLIVVIIVSIKRSRKRNIIPTRPNTKAPLQPTGSPITSTHPTASSSYAV